MRQIIKILAVWVIYKQKARKKMPDIELVIKIDEQYLKDIKECVKSGDIYYEPWLAIANGTPLPKGHGRLIDAGRFVDTLNNAQIEGLNTYKGLGRAKELLIEEPTIIESDKESK